MAIGLTACTPGTNPVDTIPKAIDSNCANMQKVIEKGIERLNYCTTDEDCTVHPLPVHPFGCFQLHNKAISFKDTAMSMQKFAKVCSTSVYQCAPTPTDDQLECRAGKCRIQK